MSQKITVNLEPVFNAPASDKPTAEHLSIVYMAAILVYEQAGPVLAKHIEVIGINWSIEGTIKPRGEPFSGDRQVIFTIVVMEPTASRKLEVVTRIKMQPNGAWGPVIWVEGVEKKTPIRTLMVSASDALRLSEIVLGGLRRVMSARQEQLHSQGESWNPLLAGLPQLTSD